MYIKKNITVIIVTYKTNRNILLNCLSSINRDINILIVENSKRFDGKTVFLKKFKNLKIMCTGSNLGYGGGNNFGLSKIKTKYALILNPDTKLKNNFFKTLSKVIDTTNNFHLLGCSQLKKNDILPAGYFDDEKNKKFKKIINTKKVSFLTNVDWIRGFSMVVNLKKFNKKRIFDQNYFLYFEEIDLCKKIKNNSGNIFFVKELKVNHLGFKGSIGGKKSKDNEAQNLRNWHYMWSSFYYYRKNYNYFYALSKMFGKLVRSFLKTLFYTMVFKTGKRNKYLFRLMGILSSLFGMTSYYRIK